MASEYIGTTYQQIQQAVADYYGTGSDAWSRIYTGVGGYYSETAAQAIKQVPGVSVTYSNSGKVLGYSYSNPYAAASNPASPVNSNVQTGSYGQGSFNNSVPATVVDNGQGQYVGQSGSRLASTGATVATVVDRLSLAAAGVALGTKLGKAIDSAIYSLNPSWWDEHYPNINPETWDDMATTQGGRQFLQGLFGINGDDTTLYMDERLLAQTLMMLLANGAYNSGSEVDINSLPSSVQSLLTPPLPYGYTTAQVSDGTLYYCAYYESGSDKIAHGYVINDLDSQALMANESVKIWPAYDGRYLQSGMSISDPHIVPIIDAYGFYNLTTGASQHTATGQPRPVTYGVNGTYPQWGSYYAPYGWPVASENCRAIYSYDFTVNRTLAAYAYALKYGTTSGGPSLDGVTDDPRATVSIDPSLITGATVDDVLNELKTNYPSLFADSIYQHTPQDDGTITRINYIPVPIPDGINTPTPTTGETSQTSPSIDSSAADSLLSQIIQLLTHPETEPQVSTDISTPTPNPPDTGDGTSPLATPVEGSASSLWKIYNPTQAEVDSFGSWLWSSNFIDQLKKLFNDPMQAIIGIHKVFCTPVVGGTTTIKCGYIDSQVSSNWVSDQYVHIDCGTVQMPEYFGNVLDYDPFTQVSLFLPCIGIVPLSVSDVMRSSINVKLHCDVITGALLAEVNVIRDQAGGILYTYAGDCKVSYPVSSGTQIGIITGVAAIAAAGLGVIASGGTASTAISAGAAAMGSNLSHMRSHVQHSGSFSGAAGVMGGKIPYLIITRPQSRLATDYKDYDGLPANYTSPLSACSGYVKVKEVHLKVPNAYESEIAEIEKLLHQGVLI